MTHKKEKKTKASLVVQKLLQEAHVFVYLGPTLCNTRSRHPSLAFGICRSSLRLLAASSADVADKSTHFIPLFGSLVNSQLKQPERLSRRPSVPTATG